MSDTSGNFQRFLLIKLVVFSTILFLSKSTRAQSVPQPKVQSPNAASLGLFGEVPVSHFTGTPDVSIPLHTVTSGSIRVPLVLRYHPASVKPNQHPGWVGLGWSLQSYGRISRTVKGFMDEDDRGGASFRTHYPSGYAEEGSAILDRPDWTSLESLRTYYQVDRFIGDAQADEFEFSFLGISGKFFYTHQGWQVVADQPIRVELNGLLSNGQILRTINEYGHGYNIFAPAVQPRQFKGFTLTTHDGTRYIFGVSDEVAGSDDAVEYQSSYVNQTDFFGLNTWNLKKIVDANGNYVVFDYARTYPVANLSFYSSYTNYACYYDWSSASGWTSANVKTSRHGGFLVWPVYLREITTVGEKVAFSTSFSNELTYPDNYLKYTDDDNLSSDTQINLRRLGNDANNLKWEQLNAITVSNHRGEAVRKYQFKYHPDPARAQRLTLKSLEEVDQKDGANLTHAFDYNDVAGLPAYGGNRTDHWGFFNNQDVNGRSFGEVYNYKQTNPAFVTKGLITRLTHPTKGYTEFDWQAHQYAAVVATDRQSLTPSAGNAGGCRIKEIRRYSAAPAAPVVKKFHYVANFSRGADPNALPSSGVLNGQPQYYFNLDNRACASGQCTNSFYSGSINSLVSYSYNGSGSHLGYSEVSEENGDGSYTRFNFTNYGTDIHGISHYDHGIDQGALGVIGWLVGEDKYITMASLELERGKPTGVFHFRNDNAPVEKTLYHYRNDAGRFEEFIKRTDLRNSIGCVSYDAVILASAFKEYRYRYEVVKEETYSYDQRDRTEFALATSHYAYNTYGQRSEVRTSQSDGSEWITRYRYVADYPAGEPSGAASPVVAAVWRMQQRRMLAPLVEEQRWRRADNAERAVSGTLYHYRDFPVGGLQLAQVFPLQLARATPGLAFAQITPAGNLVYDGGYRRAEVTHERYDERGNRQQSRLKGGEAVTHLWGYGGRYLLAEIRNATYEEVVGVLGQGVVDQLRGADPGTDDQVRGALRALRTNPALKSKKSQVIAYTHRPLEGRTSATDAAGLTTFFEYDGLQRLKWIKNSDGHPIRHFFYHHKK